MNDSPYSERNMGMIQDKETIPGNDGRAIIKLAQIFLRFFFLFFIMIHRRHRINYFLFPGKNSQGWIEPIILSFKRSTLLFVHTFLLSFWGNFCRGFRSYLLFIGLFRFVTWYWYWWVQPCPTCLLSNERELNRKRMKIACSREVKGSCKTLKDCRI